MTRIFYLLLTLSFFPLLGTPSQEESKKAFNRSLSFVPFYSLNEDEEHRDITNTLLESSNTPSRIKELMIEQNRRIILFRYPSDEYFVKGYISYTPHYQKAPLLFFLRGGNNRFGLMNPASSFSCIKNYTFIATTYRGGVSEGVDEYGGEEVKDLEHLIDYLPQLERALHLSFKPQHTFLLGVSRGCMEMFLALERSPFLQDAFDKVVALSGPTDMRLTLETRPDLKRMFTKHFGLIPGENEEEWVKWRSPLLYCDAIKDNLPILLIHGTHDNRTHIQHSQKLFDKLKKQGKDVTYWEIEGGKHALCDHPNRIEMITRWLETSS